jgi:nucleoside-triphosphatase THEP1
MINAIVVIGKPGSGKTEMVRHLGSFLTADGFVVDQLSDRIGLEEAVLEDTRDGYYDQEGRKFGSHSMLIADGLSGHRKVHVLDGYLLNRVHERMVTYIVRDREPNVVILAEYAIGPDVTFEEGREPLLQSAKHLVRHLIRSDVHSEVSVVDVEAILPVRAAREARRPDAMEPETFRAYFGDGGEMVPVDAAGLGDRYHFFANGSDNLGEFFVEANSLYREVLRPQLPLEGGKRGSEGIQRGKEK